MGCSAAAAWGSACPPRRPLGWHGLCLLWCNSAVHLAGRCVPHSPPCVSPRPSLHPCCSLCPPPVPFHPWLCSPLGERCALPRAVPAHTPVFHSWAHWGHAWRQILTRPVGSPPCTAGLGQWNSACKHRARFFLDANTFCLPWNNKNPRHGPTEAGCVPRVRGVPGVGAGQCQPCSAASVPVPPRCLPPALGSHRG